MGGSAIFVLVGNLVLATILCVFGFRWLRDTVEVSRTIVSPLPPNSDDDAVNDFLDLLVEARKEVVMYDDGDTAEGSLYQSSRVVDAIRKKIEEYQDFHVDCTLNRMHGDTLFEQKLRSHHNVHIWQRSSHESREHYKIFDGRKAYVSCHEPGSKMRNRSIIDCTKAMSKSHPRPLALRRYFDDFKCGHA